MMARGVASAAFCLLLLALGEAARPGRSMAELDWAEESRVAQLRFEAGDPACGSFRFHYRCFDVPPSSRNPATFLPQETTAHVEGAPVLVEDYRPDQSDCDPLSEHKYRCVPPTKTTAPEEVAPVVVDPSVQAYQSDQSDCGPLGEHAYRCVPPMQ